jgi:UDP-N-acetylmuramyl pentapeptide phosphotransferase/UDP-N-acetylglucosamine-1-phosphate transferase
VVLGAFLIGLLTAAVAWVLLAPSFGAEVFTRHNYRGRRLPTAAGLVVSLAILAAAAATELAVAAGAEPDDALLIGLRLVLVAALGFALLGLLDDLTVGEESGGFTSHLRWLLRGRLTTGTVKLFGGAAVALVVVALASPTGDGAPGWGRLLTDGALVALAANLGNLLDRRPGRAIKATLVAFGGLIVAVGAEPELAGVAFAVGGAAGLLVPDLRERLMLGDTGSNVLGAVLGLGVVITASPGVRIGVLVAVAVLNLLSERVSFSRVIDRVLPLRAFDRFGRVP